MYWLHLTKTQKKRITHLLSPSEIRDPFGDQSGSLHWTAQMITGNAEMAARSVIDATGLAETRSEEFRDWLVLWAHLATARTALSAVRSAIQETANGYADWSCSHHSHEPLRWAEIQSLQALELDFVVQQLDVLARTVLVLRGCHGASFEDCVFLLNVPLQSAIGAYCQAVQWLKAFTEPADTITETQLPQRSSPLLRPKWIFGV